MIYDRLPNTSIEVSKICLGTMTWGNQNTQAEAFEQMYYAFENGINFFDTAELYPIPPHPDRYAHTEKIIGNWLRETGKRDQIIIASKIAGKAPFSKFIRETGINRQSILQAVEGSLNRLQTDYMDLYQLHWPDRNTNFFGKRGYPYDIKDSWVDNIQEILETLQELIELGKIRHFGVSNETPWGLMRYLSESKKHDLPKVVTIQNPYNLLNRLYEVGISEFSQRENVGLLAYSPMGFGVLSGKYLEGKQPPKGRLALFPNYRRYSSEAATIATKKYADLARAFDISLAQMSLAFVNTQPFVTSTIIGATNMEQLKENIGSIEVVLTQELLDAIDVVQSQIPNSSP